MQFKKLNDEVYIACGRYKLLKKDSFNVLEKKATHNKRNRIRICIHDNIQEIIHEMFIVHFKNTYIRPHKHIGKSESFYIIEGTADIVFFSEKGLISEIIHMGDYSSGEVFYYKIEKPIYHSMVITSDSLIFHEVTRGPFQRADTVFAQWSPEDGDKLKINKYIASIRERINEHDRKS
jgi:cupin fold WbuC family metalloprotein